MVWTLLSLQEDMGSSALQSSYLLVGEELFKSFLVCMHVWKSNLEDFKIRDHNLTTSNAINEFRYWWNHEKRKEIGKVWHVVCFDDGSPHKKCKPQCEMKNKSSMTNKD